MRWTWRHNLPEAVPAFSAPNSSGQCELCQPCPLTLPRAGTGQSGLQAPKALVQAGPNVPCTTKRFLYSKNVPCMGHEAPRPTSDPTSSFIVMGAQKGYNRAKAPMPALLGNVSVKAGADELKTGQRRLKRPPVRSKDAHLHTACAVGHNLEAQLAGAGGAESLS